MFQRQVLPETKSCPECGSALSLDRDQLLCKEHGAFFVYGPQLLVRAPQPAVKQAETQLPWEGNRSRRA